MQVSPEQGRYISWLVATMGATRAIEVGVFTGYSAICIAKVGPACIPSTALMSKFHMAGLWSRRDFGNKGGQIEGSDMSLKRAVLDMHCNPPFLLQIDVLLGPSQLKRLYRL